MKHVRIILLRCHHVSDVVALLKGPVMAQDESFPPDINAASSICTIW
jgi:hypothetical protein